MFVIFSFECFALKSRDWLRGLSQKWLVRCWLQLITGVLICWLKGVTNFVIYKFGHLVANEWQTMYDLAKMFLHCLNHWKLETPTARKQQQQGQADDLAVYRVNYTRWASSVAAYLTGDTLVWCQSALGPVSIGMGYTKVEKYFCQLSYYTFFAGFKVGIV